MTELVVLSHLTPLTNNADADEQHFGSCGRLLDRFEAKVIDSFRFVLFLFKIIDLESGIEHNAPHKNGELWLKSPTIMKGYLNNDRASREIVDANGWLHTGLEA